MTRSRFYQQFNRSAVKPVNVVWLIIVLMLFLVGLYYLAKGIFTILTWVAPILLVATIFINYKVIINYFKMIWRNIQQKPIIGIGLLLFTVFGFPLAAGYLFLKAIASKQIDKLQRRAEGVDEFVDYEVVDEDFLELPEIPDEPTGYEELFDEDEKTNA